MKFTPVFFALTLASLAHDARAQSILRSVTGGAGQQFGASIARYVDLDGDGLPELLVGSPGTNNSAGMVSVMSSKYIHTGVGAPVLWTVLSPAPNLLFGSAVLNLGDVTGDGVADFAVGAPSNSTSVFSEVDIVSGASHMITGRVDFSTLTAVIGAKFGGSLAIVSDEDLDGVPDILVGITSYQDSFGSGSGYMILSSALAAQGTGVNSLIYADVSASQSDFAGYSVSSADVDGDGWLDFIIGVPLAGGFSSPGAVRVYSGYNAALIRSFAGTAPEGLGWSVDASRDVDGDGVRDILVGGPFAPGGGTQRGEAIVLGGAKLLANTPPFDTQHWFGPNDNEHFGWSVSATPDVNGDLIGDAVIGSPDRTGILSGHEGAVTFFSGVTGENMGTLMGSPSDHLGQTVAAAWAYDGTIHFDIAAGGPQSAANGTGSGVVRIVAMFPAVPAFYCTAKLNSLSCTPAMTYSGNPSATSASSFLINATNVLNNKNGLLFYGLDASSLPFQGGTLCVKAPVKRTSVQSTHGNPPPNDCSGSMSFNFNAYIQSGADPALYVGRQVFTQYWSRDPNSPSTTSLTNALRFLVNP